MRRRDFMAGVTGAAAMPFAIHAQERIRRIAILVAAAADDPLFQVRLGAFLQGLQQTGWSIGRNIRIDTRWATANVAEVRKQAAELTAQAPEVVLASGGTAVSAMLQVSRTVPIVFPLATDPVGSGYVETLAKPGGNVTGFMNFEYGMGGKWLELLQQIDPKIKRAGVLRDPSIGTGSMQFAAVQAVAPSLRLDVSPINMREAADVERSFATFAGKGDAGLIVTASAASVRHRNLIIKQAQQHKLPAVYPERFYAEAGGLVSYGPDQIDQFRLAAGYVDRILKGEKPADLPVQAPTRFELVINLKTAKQMGLTVPGTLLARADEVIE